MCEPGRGRPGARAARRGRGGFALPLALLAGAAAALWLAGQPAARAPHPQAMACADCHLAGATVTPDNAHLLTATQERLCAGCHEGAVDLSHPSGIAPSQPPPAELPLDWKGDVTCSTCHRVHSGEPGRLRGVRRGAAFCESCHDQRFFQAMRDGGLSIVRSGHMSGEARDAALAVDSFSAGCLECHAERSTYGDLRLTRGGIARHGGAALNHPVGKNYARWEDYGGYRPAAALPAAIRLPGGQVSCVSCHEGYSREHGALVMANDRSQLCFGCHDL